MAHGGTGVRRGAHRGRAPALTIPRIKDCRASGPRAMGRTERTARRPTVQQPRYHAQLLMVMPWPHQFQSVHGPETAAAPPGG